MHELEGAALAFEHVYGLFNLTQFAHSRRNEGVSTLVGDGVEKIDVADACGRDLVYI